MNIWQDSNNAPSKPNSSTVSEQEFIKVNERDNKRNK